MTRARALVVATALLGTGCKRAGGDASKQPPLQVREVSIAEYDTDTRALKPADAERKFGGGVRLIGVISGTATMPDGELPLLGDGSTRPNAVALRFATPPDDAVMKQHLAHADTLTVLCKLAPVVQEHATATGCVIESATVGPVPHADPGMPPGHPM